MLPPISGERGAGDWERPPAGDRLHQECRKSQNNCCTPLYSGEGVLDLTFTAAWSLATELQTVRKGACFCQAQACRGLRAAAAYLPGDGPGEGAALPIWLPISLPISDPESKVTACGRRPPSPCTQA